jgi:hypothetical protein
MPTDTYQTTSDPYPVRIKQASDNGTGLSITNASSAYSVYVDDAQTPIGSGVEIPPLGTIQWSAGQDVWLDGPVAGINVIVATSVDATVNPSGIATALLAQGLPAAIAAQIAIAGAPMIDDPTVLVSEGWVSGATHTVGGAAIDVSRYQSVIIRTSASPAGPSIVTPIRSGTTIIQHLADGLVIGREEYVWLDDNAQAAFDEDVTSPVITTRPRGDSILVTVKYDTIATGAPAAGINMSASVTGSYRAVDRPTFFGGHGYWGLGAVGFYYGTGADLSSLWDCATFGPGTDNQYPRLYSGPARVTLDTGTTTTGNLFLTLRDVASGRPFGSGIILPAAAVRGWINLEILVPNRPIAVRLTTGAGVVLPAGSAVNITQGGTFQ